MKIESFWSNNVGEKLRVREFVVEETKKPLVVIIDNHFVSGNISIIVSLLTHGGNLTNIQNKFSCKLIFIEKLQCEIFFSIICLLPVKIVENM